MSTQLIELKLHKQSEEISKLRHQVEQLKKHLDTTVSFCDMLNDKIEKLSQ